MTKSGQSRPRNTRKGMVLILTFIIMAALVTLSAAFLYLMSVRIKSSGYDVDSAKAFWLAEAGIQQVAYRLKNDPGYRANPTTVNGVLGDGNYSVTVAKNADTYSLVSTGAVEGLTRTIGQSVVATEGPPVTVVPQKDWREQ